jgi:hypothetical protein
MTAASGDGRSGWLGDVEAASGDELGAGAGKMVPAAEIGEGDAKAVRDGDQSVAAASCVEDHSRGSGGGWRLRNDQGIQALEGLARVELIGRGKFRFGDPEFAGDGGKGVVGSQAMVAPGVAPVLRDQCDALIKQSCGAGGEMQVKGRVGRSDHAQKAGIEGGEFVDGSFDQIGD